MSLLRVATIATLYGIYHGHRRPHVVSCSTLLNDLSVCVSEVRQHDGAESTSRLGLEAG